MGNEHTDYEGEIEVPVEAIQVVDPNVTQSQHEVYPPSKSDVGFFFHGSLLIDPLVPDSSLSVPDIHIYVCFQLFSRDAMTDKIDFRTSIRHRGHGDYITRSKLLDQDRSHRCDNGGKTSPVLS